MNYCQYMFSYSSVCSQCSLFLSDVLFFQSRIFWIAFKWKEWLCIWQPDEFILISCKCNISGIWYLYYLLINSNTLYLFQCHVCKISFTLYILWMFMIVLIRARKFLSAVYLQVRITKRPSTWLYTWRILSIPISWWLTSPWVGARQSIARLTCKGSHSSNIETSTITRSIVTNFSLVWSMWKATGNLKYVKNKQKP